MKLTWYGHSTFRLEIGNAKILIDPFLTQNPKWDGGTEAPAEGLTHILLTHGHFDHSVDTVDIATKTGATVHAPYELIEYLGTKGLGENQGSPCNHGGTVDYGDFRVTAWQGLHSSSVMEDGKLVYLGNPLGYVIEAPNEKTIYLSGDTGIFGDMRLINEMHNPKVGILCCGDRLTMGPKQAGYAATHFFDFDTVIPCHYGTFDFLTSDIEPFRAAVEGRGKSFVTPKAGEAVEL